MKLSKLSNQELSGALRAERDPKRFCEMAMEFITRYCEGRMVDAGCDEEARQNGYEAGYADGYAAGREVEPTQGESIALSRWRGAMRR
jgi:hypothetical protein